MPLFQIWEILMSVVGMVMLGTVWSDSNFIEGICSWNVSSGPRNSRMGPPSVYPVHFSACRQGRLVWQNPYGGVEMSFRSEVPPVTKGTYRVCLTTTDYGVNIFHKMGKQFKKLNGHDSANTTGEICVQSATKDILIYLESAHDIKTTSAVFHYRTLFRRTGRGPLRPKDCKPCGLSELIKSFCHGDFAVRGNVKSIIPIGGGNQRGEAIVVARRIFRQTIDIFKQSPDSGEITGSVNFPLHCHWKKRSKHGYLFTGSLKQNDGPVIRCRLKFHLWKKLYRQNICEKIKV